MVGQIIFKMYWLVYIILINNLYKFEVLIINENNDQIIQLFNFFDC